MRRAWRTITLLMASSLLAAACGSTVQVGGTGEPVAVGQDEATRPVDTGLGPDPTRAGGDGLDDTLGLPSGVAADVPVAPTGNGAGEADEPNGAPPAPPTTTPTAPPAAAPTAPPTPGAPDAPDAPEPVSDEPIKIGYVTTDTAGFGGNLGGDDSFSGAGDSNREAERREMEALVQYANDTGGVGGRPIEAIEFPVSVAELDAAYTERICVAAHEDHGVAAMIDRSYLNFDEAMHCFAQRGITLVGIQATFTDRQAYHPLRPYLASSWPTLDRIGHVMVTGLQEARWFDDATVGVVLDDSVVMRRVYQEQIEPAMAALGVEPVEVVYVTADSTEPAAAEVSNAVLRFQSKGVTHVFNLLSLINFVAFQNSAESQGYRPRYGFGDYGAGVSAAVGFGMPAQNDGAIAVSVDPRAVLESPDSPGWSGPSQRRPADTPENTTAGQRRCIEILSEYTGTNYYGATPSSGASLSFRWYCDHFLLWLDAARGVGASVTPQTWGDGLAALGDSYPSPLPYRTQFGPGRFDGASAYRLGEYHRSCQCFIGVGPWRDFPW